MDLRLPYFHLTVHDHDKALAFYRDVLGFEGRNDVELEGMRWVSVGPPGNGSTKPAACNGLGEVAALEESLRQIADKKQQADRLRRAEHDKTNANGLV